jgi:hypothetical protein
MPRFGDRLEDPLGPKAPAVDVVSELWGMVDPLYYMSLSEVQQRRLFREVCKAHKWNWPQVSRRLRHEAIAARSGSVPGEAVKYTPSGIPVYSDRFAHQSICPFKHKSFDLRFWSVQYRDKDCDSLSERRCGPREAEQLLQQVRNRIVGLDEVYVAEAQWDINLSNRMSQRRHQTGLNTFMYRCVDGTVSYLGDKPIRGVAPPRTSEAMPWEDALEWLVPRMWVPGHYDHGFSERWEFRKPRLSGTGMEIPLDGLSDDQIKEFERRAATGLEAAGIQPGDPIPAEELPALRDALLAIRDDLLGM